MNDVAKEFYFKVIDPDRKMIRTTTNLDTAIHLLPNGGAVLEVVKIMIVVDDKTLVTTITEKEIL